MEHPIKRLLLLLLPCGDVNLTFGKFFENGFMCYGFVNNNNNNNNNNNEYLYRIALQCKSTVISLCC